jgi:DNA-binding CsgD family transcriptional regulator
MIRLVGIGSGEVDRVEQLTLARAAHRARAWQDAYDLLARADQATSLAPDDLELLATAAYLLGRQDEFIQAMERAHHAYVAAAALPRAVRCAFWIGAVLELAGRSGHASGWLARAQRLLDHAGDCVERGYLLLPQLLEQVGVRDWEAVATTAADVAAIAERYGDRDLFALAVHEQGHALARLRRPADGLRLLDEAMLAAVAGELSPVVAGLVYCGVIAYCQDLYEVRRAREWTEALTRWCDQQPQMVAFTGRCLVHRAEIMQLGGTWTDALREAREACRRLAHQPESSVRGLAFYRQGELHRLRGEVAEAEEAYRQATRHAWDPQPGLALLRLAQGNSEAAAAAVRRALGEFRDPLDQVALLPAWVEIMLATGDLEAARDGCQRLQRVAADHDSAMLDAAAAQATGAVALAGSDPPAALVALRQAWQLWQRLEVPYEAARVRVLVGQACRALADEDAARLEFGAARATFAELGAAPDLAQLEALLVSATAPAHRLTSRELEVLRLVAAGRSNKVIAKQLVLSERTVERHVSNILAKLAVASRAAATAYAYEHQLV